MDLRKVLRHMTWLQDAEGENRPTQVPVLKKKHIYELYTACSSDAAGAEKSAGLKDLLHACVKEIYPLPEWIGKDFIYQKKRSASKNSEGSEQSDATVQKDIFNEEKAGNPEDDEKSRSVEKNENGGKRPRNIFDHGENLGEDEEIGEN
eukprot:CAMPEP_0114500968 /NCGR_PEP_ID=MMETSP0109-20121206/8247_1 /TAXON_ID=29199 /ORGANISM="Chlorarachnion reptans, Strain CCCM449" /LENGTH=148 /DNA_ID=CAMNT_0001678665 /DNA_START=351 /DNA_END=798 /DNA_ORIENTATION=-